MVRYSAFLALVIFALGFSSGCGSRKPKLELPIDKARQLVFAGKYDEGIEICDKLLVNGKDLEVLLLRGEILEKQENFEEAEQSYTTAIASHPESPKPYQRRHQLYSKLSKQDDIGVEESDRLRDLALTDFNTMVGLDPDAKKAFTTNISQKPLLAKPIPSYTAPKVVKADQQKELGEVEDIGKLDGMPQDEQAKDENAVAQKENKDNAVDTEEVETEADIVNESAQDFLVRRIREIGEPKKMEMPPHEDSETIELPDLPPRPVTRFGLPTDLNGSLVLPERRREAATGWTPPRGEFANGDNAANGPGTQLNRFVPQERRPGALDGGQGQNSPVAGTPAGVRTGIGATRSSVGRFAPTAPGGFQSGLIPQEARGLIGPRIVPLRKQARDTMDEPALPTTPNTSLQPNTAILTTALPGTTILYGNGIGGRPGNAPVTGPRLGDGGGSGNNFGFSSGPAPSRFGSITDPEYTPFGRRPQRTNSAPPVSSFPAN